MSTETIEGSVNPEFPDSDANVRSTESALKEAGKPLIENVQVDYFGLTETHRVVLPDGISWIEHTTLTEGGRRKYLNGVQRDMIVQRATGDAKMSMKPGDERYTLLMEAITDWNIIRDGKPWPFNKQGSGSNLGQFLDSAPPKIIDLIEKDVRMHNAWLLEDMTLEGIDEEIKTLQDLRAKKVEEEQGNSSS
jgi:hypothetical protein